MAEIGSGRRLSHTETSFTVVVLQAQSSESLTRSLGSGSGGEEIASKYIKEII